MDLQPIDLGKIAGGAALTVSQISAAFRNNGFRGVKVVANSTVIGTGSITVAIQFLDSASGVWNTVLASAAIVTNVTTVLTVYPGMPNTANVSISDCLPTVWRVLVTANNANAATYTVGANLLP